MRRAALLAGIAPMLFCAATPIAARAEPVLLISIDGLRPLDVIEAEKRGLKIPTLCRFLKEGSYAQGVVGVLPTLTYPSHATLLTGAAPARSGIVGNTTFDPMQINHDGWFWYAADYKVPTLWDAAAKAGLSTGNVHWPVSVAARSIRYNLPQIWRTGHADDAKLLGALATPDLIPRLEREVGKPYAAGIDESIEGDENRGAFAVQLIEDDKPDFITVYLTALDHEQHVEGPGTPRAHAILERIDAIVARLVAAEQAARPDAAIAVVSDHGFEPISQEVDLGHAFVNAGLITPTADGKVKSWEAVPWSSGGSAAIVLARPQDAALRARVAALLEKLKADPANGIATIATEEQVRAMGGNPDAAFYLDFKPGTMAGGFKGLDAPIASPSKYKGMHGYFPASPAMRSTFMVMGQGIAKGRNLGEIDMRAIAPTLAGLMTVALPDAERDPVDLKAPARK